MARFFQKIIIKTNYKMIFCLNKHPFRKYVCVPLEKKKKNRYNKVDRIKFYD